MEAATNRRGGVRPGAGRKPLPVEDRRVHVTVRLAPETAAWLRAVTPPRGSVGHVIDHLVADAMSRHDPTEYPIFAVEGDD